MWYEAQSDLIASPPRKFKSLAYTLLLFALDGVTGGCPSFSKRWLTLTAETPTSLLHSNYWQFARTIQRRKIADIPQFVGARNFCLFLDPHFWKEGLFWYDGSTLIWSFLKLGEPLAFPCIWTAAKPTDHSSVRLGNDKILIIGWCCEYRLCPGESELLPENVPWLV